MAEAEEQTKHPGGRPRLEFDLRQVEELGKIQSTQTELAAVLGRHLATVKDRLAHDDEFSAAYKRGVEAGKSSLRRLQWKAAVAGNVVMQIWLGKQYLGQKDVPMEPSREEETYDLSVLMATPEGRQQLSQLSSVLADALRLRDGFREAGPAEVIDVEVEESAGDQAERGRDLLVLPEPEAEERQR